MKTVQEIEDLKRNWKNDPCWDIEYSEGFEEHKEELRSYRLEKEEEWKRNCQEKLLEEAIPLGLENNLPLMEYIRTLNFKIKMLRDELSALKDKL